MLNPMTEKDEKAIIKSVVNAIKKENIDLLTKKAYNFVMLASGFIAHYNHQGFKDYYNDTKDLRDELLYFQDSNQWENFRPGEENYEYMMQKKKIYNAICAEIGSKFIE